MGRLCFKPSVEEAKESDSKAGESPESLAPASCVNLDKAFNFFII